MKRNIIFLIAFFFVLAFPIISYSQTSGVGGPCIIADNCDEGLFCVGNKCTESECANPDVDGDGYASIECGGDDCDDNDNSRYPGNVEICELVNSHDDDCDLSTFGDMDTDGDGYISDFCCNDVEGDDQDPICGTDCDDTTAYIHPGAPDICNGIDEDCNGVADDWPAYTVNLFPDDDNDGYGVPAPVDAPNRNLDGSIRFGCSTPMGGRFGLSGGIEYAYNDDDCNDDNSAIIPGAMTCHPEDPNMILICEGGEFVSALCADVCVPQPNGTGYCQQNKVKKVK